MKPVMVFLVTEVIVPVPGSPLGNHQFARQWRNALSTSWAIVFPSSVVRSALLSEVVKEPEGMRLAIVVACDATDIYAGSAVAPSTRVQFFDGPCRENYFLARDAGSCRN